MVTEVVWRYLVNSDEEERVVLMEGSVMGAVEVGMVSDTTSRIEDAFSVVIENGETEHNRNNQEWIDGWIDGEGVKVST